jgi:hypothetical protein
MATAAIDSSETFNPLLSIEHLRNIDGCCLKEKPLLYSPCRFSPSRSRFLASNVAIQRVTSVRLSGQVVPVALAKQLWYLTAHALPAPMAGGKKATIIVISQGSPV